MITKGQIVFATLLTILAIVLTVAAMLAGEWIAVGFTVLGGLASAYATWNLVEGYRMQAALRRYERRTAEARVLQGQINRAGGFTDAEATDARKALGLE